MEAKTVLLILFLAAVITAGAGFAAGVGSWATELKEDRQEEKTTILGESFPQE